MDHLHRITIDFEKSFSQCGISKFSIPNSKNKKQVKVEKPYYSGVLRNFTSPLFSALSFFPSTILSIREFFRLFAIVLPTFHQKGSHGALPEP
eukprot:Pgem_evm1s11498